VEAAEVDILHALSVLQVHQVGMEEALWALMVPIIAA